MGSALAAGAASWVDTEEANEKGDKGDGAGRAHRGFGVPGGPVDEGIRVLAASILGAASAAAAAVVAAVAAAAPRAVGLGDDTDEVAAFDCLALAASATSATSSRKTAGTGAAQSGHATSLALLAKGEA